MAQASDGKAELIELDADVQGREAGRQEVDGAVQPRDAEGHVRQPDRAARRAATRPPATPGSQFVGAGTTKLALQLWFDVNAVPTGKDRVDDVRRLTQKVIYFMTPQQPTGPTQRSLCRPACASTGARSCSTAWSTGMEESLEFFSPDGKPLRASIALSLSQQKILVAEFEDGASAGSAGARPGMRR